MRTSWTRIGFLAVTTAIGCGQSTRVPSSSAQLETPPALSFAVSASSGVAPAEPKVQADPLSEESLMREVRDLASPERRGRGSGTPDEAAAAQHLQQELIQLGVGSLPVLPRMIGTTNTQNFSSPAGQSTNVFGLIAPKKRKSDGYIVLGAHLDHLGKVGKDIYPGADDNASGVALVMGVAASLMRHPDDLGRSVVVVLFGAEEVGLYGSRAFVKEGPLELREIWGMINVDMVGRPLSDQPSLRFAESILGIDPDNSVGVDGLRGRPSMEKIVRDACASEKQAAVTIDDLPEAMRSTVEEMSRNRADNASFEGVGIPAVFFSSAESSDYHQPTDTVDKVSPRLLRARAKIVEQVVIGLSNLP